MVNIIFCHIFTPILRRVNISKFFILSWCSIKSFQMLFKSIKTTHRKIREIITLNTTSQLKNLFKKAIDKTKNNSGLTLILAINYSGKWDILNATKKILIDKNQIDLKIFNYNVFENYLTTANIPQPQL